MHVNTNKGNKIEGAYIDKFIDIVNCIREEHAHVVIWMLNYTWHCETPWL